MAGGGIESTVSLHVWPQEAALPSGTVAVLWTAHRTPWTRTLQPARQRGNSGGMAALGVNPQSLGAWRAGQGWAGCGPGTRFQPAGRLPGPSICSARCAAGTVTGSLSRRRCISMHRSCKVPGAVLTVGGTWTQIQFLTASHNSVCTPPYIAYDECFGEEMANRNFDGGMCYPSQWHLWVPNGKSTRVVVMARSRRPSLSIPRG